MRTRKLTIIACIMASMMLFSCEDLLDLKPVSTISSSSFWQTEEDVKSAMYGMYDQFRYTFDFKANIWGDFRTGFYGQGSSKTQSYNEIWSNELNSSTTGTNWSEMYKLLNDANLIISKSEGIPFDDQNDKDQIQGQAYFVRAYTYFQIAKLWGDAPIVTEGFESTSQDLEPARSSVSEVFAQVKSDVDMAINLLGERESVNYAGIAAANMLKADVYLWTAKAENGGESDLKEAQTAVNAVLSSGYLLEPAFESVFRDENSKEIIFSIYYAELEPGSNGEFGENPAYVTLPSIAQTPPDLIDVLPTQPNPQWIDLSEYFVNNILKPSDVDSRTDITWQNVSSSTGSASYINKYIGEVFSGTRLPTSDLIVYRYAEAILFKAEIENALGNTPEALTQLNKIAKRAYGTDNYYSGLTKDQTDDAILDERILEFVLEGKSWFDMVRFGQAFQRISTLTGRESDNSGNVLLSPVAQDVLNRNHNIEQTDGY